MGKKEKRSLESAVKSGNTKDFGDSLDSDALSKRVKAEPEPTEAEPASLLPNEVASTPDKKKKKKSKKVLNIEEVEEKEVRQESQAAEETDNYPAEADNSGHNDADAGFGSEANAADEEPEPQTEWTIFEDSLDGCWRVLKVRVQIHMHPSMVSLPLDTIFRRHLNPLLLKYSESLDGIPVCFWDTKTKAECGVIVEDTPWIHFPVLTNILAFSPKVDSTIIGTVIQNTEGFLGLLVFDTFNASINITENPFFPELVRKIPVGSFVQFTIKRTSYRDNILSLVGSITKDNFISSAQLNASNMIAVDFPVYTEIEKHAKKKKEKSK